MCFSIIPSSINFEIRFGICTFLQISLAPDGALSILCSRSLIGSSFPSWLSNVLASIQPCIEKVLLRNDPCGQRHETLKIGKKWSPTKTESVTANQAKRQVPSQHHNITTSQIIIHHTLTGNFLLNTLPRMVTVLSFKFTSTNSSARSSSALRRSTHESTQRHTHM